MFVSSHLPLAAALIALAAAGLMPNPAKAKPNRTEKASNGARSKVAAKAPERLNPPASEGDEQSEQEEVDTENLFGFTEGAETGKKDEQEVVVDSQMRFGKRRAGPGAAGYAAASTRLTYQYDPTDTFSVEFSLFADTRNIRNIVDLADKSSGTFDGGSIELKYAFQKSSKDQPLGIAIEARPRYARVLPVEGQGADLFSAETLLQIDYRLVQDKLWYGSNLGFEPSVGRLRGSGESDRSSTFIWSHAVVARIGENTFLGPELRYLRAYEGTWLNRFEGHALYLGPALYHKLSEKAFVTLAYSAQVAGHDRDPVFAGRAFDLTQFERHAARIKFGVDF